MIKKRVFFCVSCAFLSKKNLNEKRKKKSLFPFIYLLNPNTTRCAASALQWRGGCCSGAEKERLVLRA